jgi:DNA-binding response OmpR family regulator
MRILIADDDFVSQLQVEAALSRHGYESTVVSNGAEAWSVLQEQSPKLAILDWAMPQLDGIQLCRRIRNTPLLAGTYLILLTANSGRDELLTGLEAGANDYLVKPFDPEELAARVRVAAQVVHLQGELAQRIEELEQAVTRINGLEKLLPICCYCKKIRDDDHWREIDSYISNHTDVLFSHGICPACYNLETTVPPLVR